MCIRDRLVRGPCIYAIAAHVGVTWLCWTPILRDFLYSERAKVRVRACAESDFAEHFISGADEVYEFRNAHLHRDLVILFAEPDLEEEAVSHFRRRRWVLENGGLRCEGGVHLDCVLLRLWNVRVSHEQLCAVSSEAEDI